MDGRDFAALHRIGLPGIARREMKSPPGVNRLARRRLATVFREKSNYF
jgi:hypothetical protein